MSIAILDIPVEISGVPEGCSYSCSVESGDERVQTLHLKIDSGEPIRFQPISLKWTIPSIDISAAWTPGSGWYRGKPAEWASSFTSKATSNAPVVCLYSQNGINRFTAALSDALNPVSIRAGVHEETGNYMFTVTLFSNQSAPMASYDVMLRFDLRSIPYYDALSAVSSWWADLPGYQPAQVPETAKLPMYSTWYSFHQELDTAAVEEQCRIAKELGCDSVIVDDGWQTMDNKRGYAYCGDWQPERIPDMAGHVSRIHSLGMKFILWYSVPFVGKYSHAWERFKDKLLSYQEWAGAGVLDPRFPEVREYLISCYERAMTDWDLDGFKLDFVDSFNPTRETAEATGSGRDIDSVPEAVDRLLTDVMDRLRAIKPDVMIEFRQSYIGPLMRKYGNMFRAGDCPNDANNNRVSTIDIRLICGNTAAHSDMLMWHVDDSVESAAMQILNILFSVPQISVRLDGISKTHLEMVGFWLKFWREHRSLLLDNKLQPMNPDLLYPLIVSSDNKQQIAAVYSDIVIPVGQGVPDELIIINATQRDRVILDIAEDLGDVKTEARDCCGRLVRSQDLYLHKGIHSVSVPPAGVIRLRR